MLSPSKGVAECQTHLHLSIQLYVAHLFTLSLDNGRVEILQFCTCLPRLPTSPYGGNIGGSLGEEVELVQRTASC